MTIGIDEVGRGPLAGPVTAAAVAIPLNLKIPKIVYTRFFADRQKSEYKLKIKDSKKLNRRQRLVWYQWLKNQPRIKFAVASCQPKTIDRINIAKAANRAAYKALKSLQNKYTDLVHDREVKRYKVKILLDGGLKLPQHIPQKTIIKGDEKHKAIMLASIMAKVRRDRYMEQKHRLYPQYSFAAHKGYGTKVHRQAIKKYGICPLHRLTFVKNFYKI